MNNAMNLPVDTRSTPEAEYERGVKGGAAQARHLATAEKIEAYIDTHEASRIPFREGLAAGARRELALLLLRRVEEFNSWAGIWAAAYRTDDNAVAVYALDDAGLLTPRLLAVIRDSAAFSRYERDL